VHKSFKTAEEAREFVEAAEDSADATTAGAAAEGGAAVEDEANSDHEWMAYDDELRRAEGLRPTKKTRLSCGVGGCTYSSDQRHNLARHQALMHGVGESEEVVEMYRTREREYKENKKNG
jgi:hypothetical protein